jgi:hypothetical protein
MRLALPSMVRAMRWLSAYSFTVDVTNGDVIDSQTVPVVVVDQVYKCTRVVKNKKSTSKKTFQHGGVQCSGEVAVVCVCVCAWGDLSAFRFCAQDLLNALQQRLGQDAQHVQGAQDAQDEIARLKAMLASTVPMIRHTLEQQNRFAESRDGHILKEMSRLITLPADGSCTCGGEAIFCTGCARPLCSECSKVSSLAHWCESCASKCSGDAPTFPGISEYQLPKTPCTKRKHDGLYKRPTGRSLKGLEWTEKYGLWVRYAKVASKKQRVEGPVSTLKEASESEEASEEASEASVVIVSFSFKGPNRFSEQVADVTLSLDPTSPLQNLYKVIGERLESFGVSSPFGTRIFEMRVSSTSVLVAPDMADAIRMVLPVSGPSSGPPLLHLTLDVELEVIIAYDRLECPVKTTWTATVSELYRDVAPILNLPFGFHLQCKDTTLLNDESLLCTVLSDARLVLSTDQATMPVKLSGEVGGEVDQILEHCPFHATVADIRKTLMSTLSLTPEQTVEIYCNNSLLSSDMVLKDVWKTYWAPNYDTILFTYKMTSSNSIDEIGAPQFVEARRILGCTHHNQVFEFEERVTCSESEAYAVFKRKRILVHPDKCPPDLVDCGGKDQGRLFLQDAMQRMNAAFECFKYRGRGKQARTEKEEWIESFKKECEKRAK